VNDSTCQYDMIAQQFGCDYSHLKSL